MDRWYATNPQHAVLPATAARVSDSIRFEQTKPSLGGMAAMS